MEKKERNTCMKRNLFLYLQTNIRILFIKRNMEAIYRRINIRGTMQSMQPADVFEFPREEFKASSIRATAASLKENYRQAYSVSVKNEKIVVTRLN
jgi:predicted Zn-dependent protease